jgi:hypothetical protein
MNRLPNWTLVGSLLPDVAVGWLSINTIWHDQRGERFPAIWDPAPAATAFSGGITVTSDAL